MNKHLLQDLKCLLKRQPSIITDGKGGIDGWRMEQKALYAAMRAKKDLYNDYLRCDFSVPYHLEYPSKEEDFKDFFYSRSYFEGVMKFRFYVRRILGYYEEKYHDEDDVLEYEYMMLAFKRDFEKID